MIVADMATMNAGSDGTAKTPSKVFFRQISVILLLTIAYHWLLVFLQTNTGVRPSAAVVGLVELIIYCWVAFLILMTRRSMSAVAIFTLTLAGLFLLAVVREGYLDFKAFRDLLIPFLFYSLAASSSFSEFDERRLVKYLLLLVLLGGVIEIFLGASYGKYFNTFNYHVAIGTISADSAHFSGMDVTLNAIRPEGLGSTILSPIVGQRRLSSVFIEPVSLGNYCVVLAAWVLSHDWLGIRKNWWIFSFALCLMLLSDSRFAMLSVSMLAALRLMVPITVLRLVSIAAPIIGIVTTVCVASFFPAFGDNIIGRLTTSGNVFINFPISAYFGLRAFTAHFGDMGYAYVVTRFGLPLGLMLWGLVSLRNPTQLRGRRFQAMALIYVSLILSVSGTSVFALKTAALTWFLIGLGFVSRRQLQ